MAVLGIFFVLLLAVLAGLVALVVWGACRAAASRIDEGGAGSPTAGALGAHSVRRFFQYALVYAMTVLTALGWSSLLARVLGSPAHDWDHSDQPSQQFRAQALAQDVTFALVGALVLGALVWWTWRALRRDTEEATSIGLATGVTATALTALVVVLVQVHGTVEEFLRSDGDPAGHAAPALVWALVWVVSWTIAARVLPPERQLPHRVLGSTVSLVALTWGFGGVLATSLRILVGGATVVGARTPLAAAGALLVVAALAWVRYWLLGAQSAPRTTLWLVHVLVVGVAGGLLLALVGGSLTLWDVLVWVVGDPGTRAASAHFASTPSHVAMVLAGLLVWWYHRQALAEGGREAGAAGADGAREAGAADGAHPRTEVRRVYEYLVAAVALFATAAGIGTLVVALGEQATRWVEIGTSGRNTFLSALTLLAVGVPVWLVFWRRIQRAMDLDPHAEGSSPTRRIALVLILGVSTVAAVIALIAVVMTVVQDAVAGGVSAATFRSARYGLGVLVSAGAVAGYHAAVWRDDREALARTRADAGVVPAPVPLSSPLPTSGPDAGTGPTSVPATAPVSASPSPAADPVGAPAPTPAPTNTVSPGPRTVLLIGDVPTGLGQELARRTGIPVEVWRHPGGGGWNIEALTAAVAAHPGRDLVVRADGSAADGVLVDGTTLRVLEVEPGS